MLVWWLGKEGECSYCGSHDQNIGMTMQAGKGGRYVCHGCVAKWKAKQKGEES